ncbi:MAG: biotin/lipoyl-binding protein, partial [Clostridia bacterium]|nr:biotin/lipoyl-binding protein [Clostridia bacterium]
MNKYLENYQKEKNKKLKYDFLPSMLNIIEHPANKLATVCLVLIVALIITTVIWAAVFKLDIAVTATGVVAPKDDLITLNSQCTGRVSEIKVKEGDYVKKGDKIVILDKKEIEINITEYEHTLKELKVKQEWYNKVYKKLKGKKVSLDVDSSKDEEFSKIVEEIILEYKVYDTNYKTL